MTYKHLLLLTTLWSGALTVAAQSGSIVGTWALAAADKLLPDGTRTPDFGDNPHGLVIFTADGHYSVEIYRADRAKFSSDDRAKVSTEQYKDAALSMSVHFGRYTVDPAKHTISFQIDRASWPNWDDTVQVRTYELK
ncbi:MAG TPA: lipocalin-like domain-containing protein, partial [Terracidiphilus sp.]|nr:lipocalin-like domain-containing protein [Terracidiphilus sp.]